MGTGAFGVLLLRLTQRRFSATQYALLSSLFALGRTVAGPVAGVFAEAVGWRDFFLLSMAAGVPGLILLWRFAPPGTREPALEAAEARPGPAPGAAALGLRAATGGACTFLAALVLFALPEALRSWKAGGELSRSALDAVAAVIVPADASGALLLAGAAVAALFGGLLAVAALRAGYEPDPPSGS
jgi:PAT family beta-lactamase induction signal transducer AmpG